MKATVKKIIFQKIVILYSRIGQVILLHGYGLLPLCNLLDYTQDG